nr:5-bromo-4-chloroindolyl phosphate hydrolysis family protein [Phaeovibrio sulfidiphilus]
MARQVFPFARALRPLERRILAVSFCADPADRLRQAERLFTRLRRENADLARTAPGGAAAPAASAAGRAFFNDIDYRLKIANLEAFSERLPATLAPRIRDICHAAENIMEAMRADASRIPEGERFLTRYLDATTALVERWCRLPENRAPETGEADARLLALLDRLEEAFACKHARLLESDRLEYTADLNTLDRLLDMEGNRT